jgi:hypothetical protein
MFMTAFSACDNSSDTINEITQPGVSASVMTEAETSGENTTENTTIQDESAATTAADAGTPVAGSQAPATVLTANESEAAENAVTNTTAATGAATTPTPSNTDSNELIFSASNPEITITSGGTYDISGSAAEGRLMVKAGNADVTLNLNNVSLSSATRTVFRVQSAGTVTVNLVSGTNNSFLCTARVDDGGDGINCDTDMIITGEGSLAVSAYGNGIHGDGVLTIKNGNITVTNAEEGIEAAQINIEGGNIHVTTREDGVNVSDGYINANGFYMSGGSLYINSQADGLDSNANINVTGGSIVIEGPTANDNGAIDYDTTFAVSGGTIIAVGSAGMPALPTGGKQTFISANVSAAKGDTISVQREDGTEIASIVLSKKIGNIFLSTNALKPGTSYSIFVNGKAAAAAVAGESNRNGGGRPGGDWDDRYDDDWDDDDWDDRYDWDD